MAATVEDLIRILRQYDPTEPVMWQFMVLEHTDCAHRGEFTQVIDRLEDTNLYDDLSRTMFDYIDSMIEALAEEEIEEE